MQASQWFFLVLPIKNRFRNNIKGKFKNIENNETIIPIKGSKMHRAERSTK